MSNKDSNSEYTDSRRKFLKGSILLGAGSAATAFTHIVGENEIPAGRQTNHTVEGQKPSCEEVLYNGIALPCVWPPQYMRANAYDPMPLPYLSNLPGVLPIDKGRQLLVDDFLIEYTDLDRKFYQPVKYRGNPLLKPETLIEKNSGYCPLAAPFSDGCFYDPQDKLFKLWYMAGWFDGTALATSKDGIHWERPNLDVVKGTNLVLAPGDNFRRDGVSVWLDHESKDPLERFKMYCYARQGKIGEDLKPVGGFLLTSPDGIHWKWRGKVAPSSDNNTFFYNPFRKKWVFTIRKEGRPTPPWSSAQKARSGRARSYWEGEEMNAALNGWKESVFWFGADRLDKKRAGYTIGEDPQIYKLDAVGYESIMLGLIQLHYGPSNEICAKGGYPKLTELQLAFSRDGFHWDRSNRKTFIEAEPQKKESWERAYIHSVGGLCNVVSDKLYFYYTAFKGNEQNRNPIHHWNGMYAQGSMGLAILRRDGFAAMETTNQGFILTRPVRFSGSYFFVNIQGERGNLAVEICDQNGNAIPSYSREDCIPVSTDSTKQLIAWKTADNLAALKGSIVRIKFYLQHAKLFSFWISLNRNGNSGGAMAAGGPGLEGTWDV